MSDAEKAATPTFDTKKIKNSHQAQTSDVQKCFLFSPLHTISFAMQWGSAEKQPHGRTLIQHSLTKTQPRTMYRSETGTQAVMSLLSSHVETICVFLLCQSLPLLWNVSVYIQQEKGSKKRERKSDLQPFCYNKESGWRNRVYDGGDN